MSIPGIPINPEEEKKKGAQTGNNPGESAVADGSRQPLESVNAEQSIPADLAPAKVVTRQKVTAPVELEQEDATPFDYEGERAKMGNSEWLKELNQKVRDIDNEYKGRAEKASKYAKAAAWGNFFSALGQLAGGGKNTYVKPQSKYLTDAMTKADKAIEVYDAIKRSNQATVDKAKTDYMAKQEARYYTAQEASNKAIRERNKYKLEHAKGNSSETTTELNNSMAIAQAKLKGQQSIAQKKLDAKATEQQQKLEQDRRKREASAFINYRDYDKKQNYNLNESEALTLANYMIQNEGYTMEKLGLVQSSVLGQLTIKDAKALKAQVLDFISKNRNNRDVVTVLNNSSDHYDFGGNGSNNDDDLM